MRSLTSFDLLLRNGRNRDTCPWMKLLYFLPNYCILKSGVVNVDTQQRNSGRFLSSFFPLFGLDNRVKSGSQYSVSQISFQAVTQQGTNPPRRWKFSHRFQVRLEHQPTQPRPLQDCIGSWLGNSRCDSLAHFNPMSSGIRARLWENPCSQDLHLV